MQILCLIIFFWIFSRLSYCHLNSFLKSIPIPLILGSKSRDSFKFPQKDFLMPSSKRESCISSSKYIVCS